MQKNNLILLDLDNTLFNSDRFKVDLQKFFLKFYKVSEEEFYDSYSRFKSEFGAYDFFGHAEYFSKKSDEETEKEFYSYFNEVYEYPDVTVFIQTNDDDCDLIIFTLGFDRFQELKISLCPSLKKLKKIIINTDKKDYLKTNVIPKENGFELKGLSDFVYARILYVDDRPEPLSEYIHGVELFRINRPGNSHSYMETPETATEIKSFDELEDYL